MITLGLLNDIDFKFWLKSNDYYSPDKFRSETGFTHAERAGLINKTVMILTELVESPWDEVVIGLKWIATMSPNITLT